MYGYQCEYCEGTVQPRIVKREAFKHRDGFVILENVTIGVCDNCGNRYYSADILHAVHAVVTGARAPERTEQIPVMHLESAQIAQYNNAVAADGINTLEMTRKLVPPLNSKRYTVAQKQDE